MVMVVPLASFVAANANDNPKKLPDGVGVDAVNLDTSHNDFRGLRAADVKHTLTGLSVQQTSFYRFDRDNPAADNNTDIYLTFAEDVNFASSMLAQDATGRVYYSGDGVPKYTDSTLIGTPPYPTAYRTLGVPAPGAAMIATLGTEGDGTDETRVYTDTFLRANGDESAPNPNTTTIVVKGGSTVNLSSLAAAPSGSHGITQRCIYVSVGGGAFQRVAQQAVAITTYTDTGTRGLQLTTGSIDGSIPAWLTPPDDLAGLMPLWNGMFGGFVGKSFRMCVPYSPHAWPAEYEVLITDTIVGAAKFAQTVVLATTGQPRVVAGSAPTGMNESAIEWHQGCVAKRSVVGVGHGVCWASNDGLAYHGQRGTMLLTERILSREAWRALVPASIIGANWGRYYIGFYNDGARKAFMVDTTNPVGIIWLTQGAYGVFQDTVTEALYILDTAYRIRRWDSGAVQAATFKSKVYRMSKPTNPGAARVIGTTFPCTFRLYALKTSVADPGSRVWTLIHTKTVTNDQPFRLPGGYSSEEFQCEVVGTGPLEAVLVAEEMGDLP